MLWDSNFFHFTVKEQKYKDGISTISNWYHIHIVRVSETLRVEHYFSPILDGYEENTNRYGQWPVLVYWQKKQKNNIDTPLHP